MMNEMMMGAPTMNSNNNGDGKNIISSKKHY